MDTNLENSTESYDEIPCVPLAEEIAFHPVTLGFTAALVFVIGLIGTFGNILAVMSLLSNVKLRKKPSTYFMVNLPACLIPVTAFLLPMFGAGCIQQLLYGCVTLSGPVCVAVFTIGLILSQVHIHTICALAFNRLVAVVWPEMYKKHFMSQVKVTVYLVVLWIYSILLWLLLAAGVFGHLEFDPEELLVSSNFGSTSRAKKAVHHFITYILPVLFTSVCYIIMFWKVKRIKRVNQNNRVSVIAVSDSNVIQQWEDHVTRTIGIIYAVLIVCSVPHGAIHFLHLYKTQKTLWLFLHVIFWFQFCLDPIVYVICSDVYRRAVVEFLSRIFPRVGFFQVDDQSPQSVGKSDFKVQENPLNSPVCSRNLRSTPQKVEFSSEVNRDLPDPKILPGKS